MTFVGWLGGVLLAVCAIPFAWQCYKQKHADGVSNLFIAMWMAGEILTFSYVLPRQDYPLLFNYALNIMCLCVVIRYKFKKKQHNTFHEEALI